MARLPAALLALVVAVAAVGAARGQDCPVGGAQVAKLNFTQAAQSCKAGIPVSQLCDSCICALVEAFTPLVDAAGISDSQLEEGAATQLLTACAGIVLGPLQRAGVSISTLFQLQQCQNAMPSCLPAMVQPQANATQPLPAAQPTPKKDAATQALAEALPVPQPKAQPKAKAP